MKTVIRNSYTPQLGDYCNKIVVDKETNTIYFFDTDGVFTEVDNTRVDVDAIIAEAVAEAGAYTDEIAETKVDKEEGKGLSSNDFTDAEKEKLEGVEAGAQENVIEIVKRNGSALTVTDKTVDILVPTKTSDLTNDSGFVINTVDDLVNYYTKTQTDDAIALETTAREGADQNLQEQIDAIAAGSDVVDIVGTYAELQAYDTSKLHNNDIIKVLSDETRSGATTYYRWSTTAEDFSYIGSQGPFYTKSESDSTFVPQTRTVNGKALSSDITLDATDVGALPNSTVIPTVNDATLTIQKNGTTVTTFTANSATNTTANITVPTKTSDLTNDGADGTDTYVEAGDLAAVATSGAYSDLTGKPSIPTKTSDLTNDSDFVSDANYVHTDNNFTTTLKNKLDGIAAGAEVNVQSDWTQADNTADDYIKNKPSIPTKTSDLTNDSGFITSAALPTKLSDLTNDTGFITKSVSDLTNYYDQTTINNMFNALSVPTKTSDLVNDSGFVTDTDYASASTGGVVKVGSGLSIDANGVLSSTGLTSVDWTDVTNKPTNVSYWTNDAGYITSAAVPTKTSDLTNDSGFITSASLPTKTSDLTNDSGYITSSVNDLANYYTKSDTYTQSEVNSLLSAITIPTKTSDLTNDGSDGTSTYVEASDLATVATSGSYNDLTNKPAAFELVEMSYGESNAWAKFIDAYQGHKIVYCRASSNSNPATGSQNRKAFMAYVNDATNPTEVEFQYVRSVSTKTSSQPVDQVFVYKLTSASGGTWTVQTRDMGPKLAQGTNTTVSYSNGTYTISATQPTVPTKTSDLTNDSGFLTSTDYATASTGGVIKVGSGLEITNGVLSATGGGTADAVEWTNVLNRPSAVSYWTNDAGYITSAAIPSNVSAFSNDAGYLTSIPTASASTLGGIKVGSNLSIDANGVLSATQPTVGDATLTIQKNGTSAGTFTANATSNKTINITVPTTAADVSALPASTKYGAGIAVTVDTTNYKVTTTLRDQDGNTLGTAQVIDLPLESVVVNGSYDSTNKKIVLTLQNGNTIDIPVADLVAGLQSEITSTNKLASDLVDDTNQTNKFMTSAEKTKLSGIAAGAEVNVQSDWNQTTNTADDYIKNKPTLATVATSGSYNDLSNKPTIPTVNNATLTIQKNGTNVQTFTANQSTNATANITVPTAVSDLSDANDYATKLYVQSRGENLVTNGSGLLQNNYNFSSFTFDPLVANGTPGSFRLDTLNAIVKNDELIPVDITQDYKFSFDIRTTNSSARFYDTIFSYDIDGNQIMYYNVNWLSGTTTTLSQKLSPGDTVVHLTSLSGWNTTTTYSYQKGFIFWNYVNSLGYAWGTETYSRNMYRNLYTDNSAVNKTANTITLDSAWAGPEIPAGTSVSQCTDGSNYIYVGTTNYTVTADTWVHRDSILTKNLYRAGTAFVGIGWLANRNITGTISTWFNNVQFAMYAAPVTVDSALSSTSTNPVQNKVISTALSSKANTADLATVATSGSYNDLSNKPTIPTVNNATLTIQKNGTTVKTFTANASSNVTANITVPTKTSDLTNDSGFLDSVAWGDVTGKPTFATVATSGSYNDLSNKPTIPTVNNGTLTIQKNGTNVQTFTANQSGNATANITVPTAVSELNNDSGYQTAAQVQTAVDGKQDSLTAGGHIDITNDVISATDYVHSENPVSTSAVTPIVTGSMITNGTITADKLATGATIQLTLSTTDIGEGAALAANTLYGVYQ